MNNSHQNNLFIFYLLFIRYIQSIPLGTIRICDIRKTKQLNIKTKIIIKVIKNINYIIINKYYFMERNFHIFLHCYTFYYH